jgi:glyoxylase-like metal-dependent hydrolase (beta-lactamase superfamily II)
METVGGQEWIMPKASKALAKSVDWLCPNFADEKGRMKFAIQLMIVDAPGIRIAVDTCVGNDKKRPLPHWNMRTHPFLEHLSQAGFTPATFTHVYCTHMHTDHIGWNTVLRDGKWVPTFPNAKYLFGKKEFEYWSTGGKPGDPQALGVVDADIEDELVDSVRPVMEAGLHELVDFDHVLYQDDHTKIYLRPTLGHTPGHTSLMIESEGQQAIITGDCFHHPIQFTETAVGSRADTDAVQATATREGLLSEFCGSQTLVFGTHFARPTCGTVVRHSKNYRLDTEAANAFLAKLEKTSPLKESVMLQPQGGMPSRM